MTRPDWGWGHVSPVPPVATTVCYFCNIHRLLEDDLRPVEYRFPFVHARHFISKHTERHKRQNSVFKDFHLLLFRVRFFQGEAIAAI